MKNCKMRLIKNGATYCAKSKKRVPDDCNICNQFTVLEFPTNHLTEKYAVRIGTCQGRIRRILLSGEVWQALGSPKWVAFHINEPKTKLMIKSCGEGETACLRVCDVARSQTKTVNRSALARFVLSANKAENPHIITDYVYDAELNSVILDLGESAERVGGENVE